MPGLSPGCSALRQLPANAPGVLPGMVTQETQTSPWLQPGPAPHTSGEGTSGRKVRCSASVLRHQWAGGAGRCYGVSRTGSPPAEQCSEPGEASREPPRAVQGTGSMRGLAGCRELPRAMQGAGSPPQQCRVQGARGGCQGAGSPPELCRVQGAQGGLEGHREPPRAVQVTGSPSGAGRMQGAP